METVIAAPGKIVRTQLSENSWKNSKILIMTDEESRKSIYSLTDRLLMELLLDSLDHKFDDKSFFSFVEVGGQAFDSESQQASQLALLCSSGSFSSSERILSLYIQKAEESS